MPLKISVSMSEKAQPPECGSLTAHCSLEFDDESAASHDSEAFQHKIRTAITALCQAVHEEMHPQ